MLSRWFPIILVLLILTGVATSCSTNGTGSDDSSPSAPPIAQPNPTEPEPAPVAPPELEVPFPGLNLVWTETTRSPIALYESQGLAADNLLYIFGGYYNRQIQATKRSFAFNPASGRWSRLAAMPQAITHAGQALYQNKIYLAGGFVGPHPGPATDHVWVYDISSDTWSAGPSLPKKIGAGALVELGGRLHFFGGTVRRGSTYIRDSSEHWVLDLTSVDTTWTDAAPMPDPRNHIAGAAVGGKIYAVGGQFLGDEDYGNQKTVDVYDPATDRWSRVADLPIRLGHISAGTFAYAGRIIVVMGVTQERVKTRDIFAYDPEKDVWEPLTRMPGGRSATVAGIINGEIVLATGNVAGGPLDTTWIGNWEE